MFGPRDLRLLHRGSDPQHPLLKEMAFDGSVLPWVGDVLQEDRRSRAILLVHCRQAVEEAITLREDEGVAGLDEEGPLDEGLPEPDCVSEAQRLRLVEEDET